MYQDEVFTNLLQSWKTDSTILNCQVPSLVVTSHKKHHYKNLWNDPQVEFSTIFWFPPIFQSLEVTNPKKMLHHGKITKKAQPFKCNCHRFSAFQLNPHNQKSRLCLHRSTVHETTLETSWEAPSSKTSWHVLSRTWDFSETKIEVQ